MKKIIELIMVGSIITAMATGCNDESEFLTIQESDRWGI